MKYLSILFLSFCLIAVCSIDNGNCIDNNANLDALVGIWQCTDQGFVFLKINNDGSYTFAHSVDVIDTRPVEKGNIVIDMAHIDFVSSQSIVCDNLIGKYDVSVLEKNKFKLVVREDPCGDRRGTFAHEYYRVEK